MTRVLSSVSPTVQLEGLYLRFPQCEVFANLSAHIPPGVALVQGGESRGKTSLLRIVAGELAANAGSVRINGIEVEANPDAWRKQVFWVNPRTDAFNAVSAADFFSSLRPVYARFDELTLQELVESLSITPHMDKPLYMLSTGSRRKVWLAAAFASGAPVTLLDEPFAALDASSIACVKRFLTQSARQPERVLLFADYAAPGGVPLASTIDLGD